MIYFIQDASTHEIKIRYTSGDPFIRLSGLQVSTANPLRLLAVIPRLGKGSEGKLHRRFRHVAVRGEWFKDSPDLLGYISAEAIAWRNIKQLRPGSGPKTARHVQAVHDHLRICAVSRAPSPECLTAANRWFHLLELGMSPEEIADREDTDESLIVGAIERFKDQIPIPIKPLPRPKPPDPNKHPRQCARCGSMFTPIRLEWQCRRCTRMLKRHYPGPHSR